MKRSGVSRAEELPRDQVDRIQVFEADYNAIDRDLRKELAADRASSFTSLVAQYSRKHPRWPDRDLLMTLADVRNAIVHGKTEPYRYVAVPTPEISRRLSECRARLVSPIRAIPAFQKRVETLSGDDTLARVLKLIDEKNYSQFPIYSDGKYCGLLTENGITRWLAHYVARTLSLIELDEISVKSVLRSEVKRVNCHFVARDTRVDDVSGLFSSGPLLEAVLITHSGRDSEVLIGIATRWDVLLIR